MRSELSGVSVSGAVGKTEAALGAQVATAVGNLGRLLTGASRQRDSQRPQGGRRTSLAWAKSSARNRLQQHPRS